MNLPPDIKHVFAAFARSGVKCLLMGGQACVQYGAAQFSKGIDFEEERERAADRAYWEPLKKQLEELRRRKA